MLLSVTTWSSVGRTSSVVQRFVLIVTLTAVASCVSFTPKQTNTEYLAQNTRRSFALDRDQQPQVFPHPASEYHVSVGEKAMAFLHMSPGVDGDEDIGVVIQATDSQIPSFEVLNFEPLGINWYTSLTLVGIDGNAFSNVPLPEKSRVAFPRWSNDGKRLSFIVRIRRETSIYIVDTTTWHVHSHKVNMNLFPRAQRGRSTVHSGPAPYHWSPDGSKLFYAQPLFDRFDRDQFGVLNEVIRGGTTARKNYGNRATDGDDDAASDLRQMVYASSLTYLSVDSGRTGNAFAESKGLFSFSISPTGDLVTVNRSDQSSETGMSLRWIPLSDKCSDVPNATGNLSMESVPNHVIWSKGCQLFLFRPDGMGGTVVEHFSVVGGKFELLGRVDGLSRPVRYFSDAAIFLNEGAVLEFGTDSDGQLTTRRYETPGGDWEPVGVARKVDKAGGARLTVFAHSTDNPISDVERKFFVYDGEMDRVSEFTGTANRSFVFAPAGVVNGGGVVGTFEAESSRATVALLNRRTSQWDPFRQFQFGGAELAEFHAKRLRYQRQDGVELSGDLYLPEVCAEDHASVPLIVWQYPLALEDQQAVDDTFNSRRATYDYEILMSLDYIGRWLPLAMLEHGFAVLYYPDFPLLGVDGGNEFGFFDDQAVLNAHAALDAVADIGCVDGSARHLAGHSRGGGDALSVLRKSDRFDTGLAFAPATIHTTEPTLLQYERRTYWEYPEAYIRNSPLLGANEVDEPVLLVHGMRDGSVPYSDSMSMFRSMERTGGEARIVLYPFAAHNLSSGTIREDLVAEVVRWLTD